MRLLQGEDMGPRIDAVSAGISRPTWSVMIPTYNCARLLVKTLSCVLSQDPGSENMQIEVVDDCSTHDNPEGVVREFGRGRVAFYRQPQNVGATRNFNSCLDRSVGHLVHILHGDDWVLPGFYDRVELSTRRHAEAVLFGTRAFYVDEGGNLDSLSPRTPSLERPGRDISPFVYANPFCTPAMVVRRGFYESSGGFLPELIHTADWEMWVRAIGYAGGFMLNEPLACYRRFAGNDTNRLTRTGDNLRDFLRLGDIFSSRYGGFNRPAFVQMVANAAAAQARNFRHLHDNEAAAANERLLHEISQPM